MPTKYYKLCGRNITLREYRRLLPDTTAFFIAAIFKPFGGCIRPLSAPLIDRLPVIDVTELPESVVSTLSEACEGFEAAGYRHLFVYRLPVLEADRILACAVFLSEDNKSIAQAMYCQLGPCIHTPLWVSCWRTDDTCAAVTNYVQVFDRNPAHRVERYPNTDALWLAKRFPIHSREWEATESSRAIPLNESKVRELLLRAERDDLDFDIRRGVYVPMTVKDLAKYGIVDGDEP